MTEPTVTENNGQVAVLSNGDRFSRGTVNSSIGYHNIISAEAWKQVFAIGSTMKQVEERLTTAHPSSDGGALGTVLSSPVRITTNPVDNHAGVQQLIEQQKRHAS